MMRLLYYLCWTFVLAFMFIAGVGSAGSLWGGFLVLALAGSMYVIIVHGPN
jgi:hypothetical protein